MVLVIRDGQVRDVPDTLYQFMLTMGFEPYLDSVPELTIGYEPEEGAVPRYDQDTNSYLPYTVAELVEDLAPEVAVHPTLLDIATDAAVANRVGTGALTRAALVERSSRWDVVADGAVPIDGTTLADTALDNLLDQMNPGDILHIPHGAAIKLAARRDIAQRISIEGNGGTIVQASNTGVFNFVPGSDGSSVKDLEGVGPDAATFAANSMFLRVTGTLADYVEDLDFEGVRASGWGYGTMQAKYARRITTRNVHTEDNHYAGQEFLSCENVNLYNPTCDGLTGLVSGAVGTCYPVAFTRDSAQPLVDAPRTYDAKVFGGWAKDTPWESLDCHAAVGVRVFAYDSWNTYKGISFVGSPDEGGVQRYAPIDCWAFNCTADSEVSDGTASDGFQLCGQDTYEQATGGFIACTAIGHGTATNTAGSGAFRLRHTDGALLQGIRAIEPAPAGLTLVTDNYGLIVDGFDIVDPWSDTYGGGANGIQLFDAGQIISLANVRLRAGTKVATYLRASGLRALAGDITSKIYWGHGNDLAAATSRFAGGGAGGPLAMLRHSSEHAVMTQTYTTAQNVMEALNMVSAVDATAATNSTPYGYSQSQANAITAGLNLARLDIISMKKTVNGLINALQDEGLIG